MFKQNETDSFVPMSIKKLVEECRSFKDISSLSITETEIMGSLASIEPYCKHLSQLTVQVKENHDIEEYEAVTDWPNLKTFTLLGQHEPGSLEPFLKNAARNGFLAHLHLDTAELDVDEVAALTSINSLKSLKCGFSDHQSVGLLSKMASLNTVIITTELNTEIAKQVALIFKNAKGDMMVQLKQRGFQFRMERQAQLFVVYLPHHDPIDMTVLAPLSELHEIRYLTIRGPHQSGSLADLFRGFGASSSSKLQEVVIYSDIFLTGKETAAVATIKPLKVLECGFVKPLNTEQLSNPTALLELCIVNLPKASMKDLFAALASKKEPTLQYFILTDGMLHCEETEELVNIKSLKYLVCRFQDVGDLERIGELPHLEFAYITVRQRNYQSPELSKNLLRFLVHCQKEGQVKFRGCCVTYNQLEGLVIVVFKNKESDADLCALLGWLGNVKQLRISGRPAVGNLKAILEGVLLHNKLELLLISKLKPHEIPVVAQMDSLTKITVGFLQRSKVQLLARLPHLKWLCITVHLPGSLECLFYDLAERVPTSKLETLTILEVYLVPEELAEVSRIRSLRRFRCGLVDPYNEWSLTELSVYSLLEELYIQSYQSGSLVELFRAIKPMSYFHRLIVRGCRLTTREVKAIKGIRTLRTLQCSLDNARDIGFLERLPLLEELVIESIGIIHRNPLAILANKERQTLKKLVIKNRSLGSYDFKSLALMSSLKSLDIIIHNASDVECLALLNLSELKLNCPQEINIIPLLAALSDKDPHVLCSFELVNKLLTEKPTKLLLQVKSLRVLKIGFSDLESLDLLSQQTELEVLEIKNKTFRVKHIIEILRNCRKLREIHFLERNEKINTEFISQCMDTLKTVRNPRDQPALQMFFDSLYCLSFEQQYSVDESILAIKIKTRPPIDDFNDEIFVEPPEDTSDSDEPKHFVRNPEKVPEESESDSSETTDFDD
ncbi:uncharacterized protein LOC119552756 [Drosophila subpulchrella]|uniref:uncharacterized protein LOC119552756 n=1 Tax=Drosophila subpulchrella TaxID=1486046 RepID=UPI0018A1520F|nr:uncharacterized protein LOC119552756 [Drosophila subpulchrella]